MPDSQTKPELLSDETLAEIEARANAATGGWYIEDEKDAVRYGFRIYDKYHQGVCKMTNGGEFHDRPHSQFILHARTDIPALIQTVRALRAQLQTKATLVISDIAKENAALRKLIAALEYGGQEFREIAEGEITRLREQLAQVKLARDQLSSGLSVRDAQLSDLRSQLAQVENERQELEQL